MATTRAWPWAGYEELGQAGLHLGNVVAIGVEQSVGGGGVKLGVSLERGVEGLLVGEA